MFRLGANKVILRLAVAGINPARTIGARPAVTRFAAGGIQTVGERTAGANAVTVNATAPGAATMDTLALGTSVAMLSVAVLGTHKIGLRITGVNVVVTKAFVVGVADSARPGAKLVRLRAFVLGIQTTGLITVGEKAEIVSVAVPGVQTN